MLFHKSPTAGVIDASISQVLLKANVLEHVWNLALLTCYQVPEGLGQNSENDELSCFPLEVGSWLPWFIQMQYMEHEQIGPSRKQQRRSLSKNGVPFSFLISV